MYDCDVFLHRPFNKGCWRPPTVYAPASLWLPAAPEAWMLSCLESLFLGDLIDELCVTVKSKDGIRPFLQDEGHTFLPTGKKYATISRFTEDTGESA